MIILIVVRLSQKNTRQNHDDTSGPGSA